jgi:beta-galactosidase
MNSLFAKHSHPPFEIMKSHLPSLSVLVLITAWPIALCGAAPRLEHSFDADWRFHRGDAPGAETAAFDDTSWRVLDVPHDWSIEDAPNPTNDLPSLAITRGVWRFSRGDDPAWAAPGFDDHGWTEVRLPGYFDETGYTNEHCFGWCRRLVTVPEALRGKDFLLNVGVVDDADETYFNGEKIGGIGGMPPHFDGSQQPWTKPRVYRVPAALVRAGGNVVAVRVYNEGARGGICGDSFTPIGPFSPDSPGGASTGYVLGGTGWYRKHFTLGADSADRLVSILFDGVYMDADVWLNGRHLGNHPYGYTAFGFDLTPDLRPPGETNVLAVRVRNLGRNSRWYSGSGIYRHVRLTATGPVHVPLWGLAVTTPEVTSDHASVNLVTTVTNSSPRDAAISLRASILGPNGKTVKSAETQARVAAGGQVQIPQTLEVRSPALWSPELPRLYRAEVEVLAAGEVQDRAETTFGVREIHFTAEGGFTLNGKPVLLRGGCVHHDNGPLGSAAIDRAEERRVELLKASGFNAIRTSHNPPSTAFLDACDRLGMLVLDEAFDCWEKGKNPEDYHRFFKDWWERDLASMVLRDRNHPSVVLWSIGNEIPERAEPSGVAIAAQLRAAVKRLDSSRPVTAAICSFWDHPGWTWSNSVPAFESLDVGGYNYLEGEYAPDHARFPERIMVGTESYPHAAFVCWQPVERDPWVVGDFVWTAFDYLGESGIGHARLDNEPGGFGRQWPWFNAFCGDLDICGFKKPQSLYRDVLWHRSPLEVLVHMPMPPGRTERISDWGWPDELPCWTWPGEEGKPLQVSVYTRCEAVRLELNGKEIATRTLGADSKLTARFEVPYSPGKLRAVGLSGGKTVASQTLRTAGSPKRLRLVADRSTLHADRNDLCYVTVEVTDAAGDLVPAAALPVRFSVSGAGELAAVGSGNPNLPESFRSPLRTTFHGRCLAILRPSGNAGVIRLRAEADTLKPAAISIRTR